MTLIPDTIEIPIRVEKVTKKLWIAEVQVEDFWPLGFGRTKRKAVEEVEGLFYSAIEGLN